MNFLQLLNFTKSQLQQDTFFTDNEIKDSINYALQEEFPQATRYTDYEATTTSVANQEDYTLPDDCVELDEVSYDGEFLVFMELREIMKLKSYTISGIDNTGVPDNYTVLSNRILRFFPIPDLDSKEIKIYYRGKPPALSGDSDVPGIPSQFHRLLAFYVLWQAKMKDNELEQGEYYRKLFEEGKMKAKLFLTGSQPSFYAANEDNDSVW